MSGPRSSGAARTTPRHPCIRRFRGGSHAVHEFLTRDRIRAARPTVHSRPAAWRRLPEPPTPRPARTASARARRGSSPSPLLAAPFGGACWYAVSTLGGMVAGAQASGTSPPSRTRRRALRKAGEVPALYQRRPAWADGTYAGGLVWHDGAAGHVPDDGVCRADRPHRHDPRADMGAFSERLGCATPGRHRLGVHDRWRGRA